MVFLSPPETLDRFIAGSQNITPLPETPELIDPDLIKDRRGNLRLWKEVCNGNINNLPPGIVRSLKELWAVFDNKQTAASCACDMRFDEVYIDLNLM